MKGFLITIAVIYLAICSFFAYSDFTSVVIEKIYKVCGDKSHPFCRCQASNAAANATFFIAPLVAFNIIPAKRPSEGCDHLNK